MKLSRIFLLLKYYYQSLFDKLSAEVGLPLTCLYPEHCEVLYIIGKVILIEVNCILQYIIWPFFYRTSVTFTKFNIST